jgi:hypothetical protein
MKRFQVFMWAAMHSPGFKYCYVKFPLRVKVRRLNWVDTSWSVEFHLQLPGVYLPWEVVATYLDIHEPGWKERDDIPF